MTARSDRFEAARIFREEALSEGFSRFGVARALPPARFERFRDWIAAGRHAGMAYLERTVEVRSRPQNLLPGAKSVVCLAAPHRTDPLRADDGSIVGPMWEEVGERLLWNYVLATFWPIAAAFEDYIAVLLDEMKSDDVPRFADRSR